MTSGYTFGRPAKLKPPAEYKFKSFFSVATKDQVIYLSTSVTDEVGRRSTVPELPPKIHQFRVVLGAYIQQLQTYLVTLSLSMSRIPVTQDEIPRGPSLRTLETTSPWYQHEKERGVITLRLG